MNDLRLSPGTIIDDSIQIEEFIGEGGMGSVYKARHLSLERVIALKLLPLLHLKNEESLHRFKREAKALALLSHHNIVGFYSYGLWQGHLPYIAMEFIEGKGLDKILAENKILPAERMLTIILQTAEGLSYAHKHGIIHRDLKPANILVSNIPEPDTIKLLDFGLARFLPTKSKDTAKLTETGLLVGSVNYMSPEQCSGRTVDQRSDIYSLGCIIYQMLCGKPPFCEDNPLAIIHKHLSEAAPAIPESILASDRKYRELGRLCKNCMGKDPEQRYQNIETLIKDIIQIRQDGDITEFAPKKITNKLVLAIVIPAVFALALFGFFILNDTALATIEAHFIVKFGDKKSWEFGIAQAQQFSLHGRYRAAAELLKSSLAVAKKFNEPSQALARIESQLAWTLKQLGLKNESLSFAERSLSDFITAPEKTTWAKLKADGFTDALSSLLKFMPDLHSQNRNLRDETDNLMNLLLSQKEYDTAILLAKERLAAATTSRKSDDGSDREKILTMQQSLIECFLKANRKQEAMNLLKLNLSKCQQWRAAQRLSDGILIWAKILKDSATPDAYAALHPSLTEAETLLNEQKESVEDYFRVCTLQTLARAYITIDRKDDAVQHLSKAEEIIDQQKNNSDFPWALFLEQCRIYDLVGEQKKALDSFGRAVTQLSREPKRAELVGMEELLTSANRINSLVNSKEVVQDLSRIARKAKAHGLLNEPVLLQDIFSSYALHNEESTGLPYLNRLVELQTGKSKKVFLLTLRNAKVRSLLNQNHKEDALAEVKSIIQSADPQTLKTSAEFEQVADSILLCTVILITNGQGEEASKLVNKFWVPPNKCTENIRCTLDIARAVSMSSTGNISDCEKLSADLFQRELVRATPYFEYWSSLAKVDLLIHKHDFKKAANLLETSKTKFPEQSAGGLAHLFIENCHSKIN